MLLLAPAEGGWGECCSSKPQFEPGSAHLLNSKMKFTIFIFFTKLTYYNV
uniref:Uncharacterized protein n=1 Tax=Arundo donax TaxID=35708 RepID=A0A0A9SGG5_ARUDO